MRRSTLRILFLAALIFGGGLPLAAEESKTEISAGAAYASRYVWRGLLINAEPVFQPGLGFSGGGFLLSLWANLDLTDGGGKAGYGEAKGEVTELDLSAAGERQWGKVKVGGGFITYVFPYTGAASTTEIYGRVTFDLPLSPALTAYVDVDENEGADYTSLDLTERFDLRPREETGIGLVFFAHAGYADGKYVRSYYGVGKNVWHDWSAGLTLPVSLGRGFMMAGGFYYSGLLREELRQAVERRELSAENMVFTLSLSWSGEV